MSCEGSKTVNIYLKPRQCFLSTVYYVKKKQGEKRFCYFKEVSLWKNIHLEDVIRNLIVSLWRNRLTDNIIVLFHLIGTVLNIYWPNLVKNENMSGFINSRKISCAETLYESWTALACLLPGFKKSSYVTRFTRQRRIHTFGLSLV